MGRLTVFESEDRKALFLWDLESRQGIMAITDPRVLGVSLVSPSWITSHSPSSRQIKDVVFRPGWTVEEGTMLLTSVNKGGREAQLGKL